MKVVHEPAVGLDGGHEPLERAAKVVGAVGPQLVILTAFKATP